MLYLLILLVNINIILPLKLGNYRCKLLIIIYTILKELNNN